MSMTQDASDSNVANGSTRIVMLGTGTPRPDPNRSGPATAIVVNDTPYLIDFGPGVIRRAAAAYEKGLTALGYGAVNIKTVFLTHMHTDHTVGYPDLIFSPWVMGRHEPLAVYGPTGIKAMTEHVLKAWQLDIDARAGGLQPAQCGGLEGRCTRDRTRRRLPGWQRHGHGVFRTARGDGRFIWISLRRAGPRHRDLRRHRADPGAP